MGHGNARQNRVFLLDFSDIGHVKEKVNRKKQKSFMQNIVDEEELIWTYS